MIYQIDRPLAQTELFSLTVINYNGKKSVLKEPRSDKGPEEYRLACKSLTREENHLKLLRGNQGVVQLLESSFGDPAIIINYVQGLTLAEFIREGREKYLQNMLLGEQYVHHVLEKVTDAARIQSSLSQILLAHADFSPSNIILNPQVTLIDYGSSVGRSGKFGFPTTPSPKKSIYCAPEQILHTDVNETTDTYSLAMTLWESLEGLPLRNTDHSFAQENELKTAFFSHHPYLAREITTLIRQAAAPSSFDRPKLEEFADALSAIKI